MTLIERPKIEYTADNLRDPFMSNIQFAQIDPTEKLNAIEEKEQSFPDLQVQAIVWGGNFPQAIINNTVVKIGDTISGVRIDGIDKTGIDVFYGGRKQTLHSPAAGDNSEDQKNPKRES